jgi:hypothetical protein
MSGSGLFTCLEDGPGDEATPASQSNQTNHVSAPAGCLPRTPCHLCDSTTSLTAPLNDDLWQPSGPVHSDGGLRALQPESLCKDLGGG